MCMSFMCALGMLIQGVMFQGRERQEGAISQKDWGGVATQAT